LVSSERRVAGPCCATGEPQTEHDATPWNRIGFAVTPWQVNFVVVMVSSPAVSLTAP
jgi:hypothetical protein